MFLECHRLFISIVRHVLNSDQPPMCLCSLIYQEINDITTSERARKCVHVHVNMYNVHIHTVHIHACVHT